MMNRNRYKLGFSRFHGVTLPELMVAVAITIGMLLLTGMVFKSATDASGQAMAYSEILQQARAVFLQLDQDFRGLRPDLPMAIIFEGYDESHDRGWGDPDEIDKVIRCDRMVFFANGNYQIQDHSTPIQTTSANVARIFYGQSADPIEMLDSGSPDRRILFRRSKLLTTTNVATWVSNTSNDAISWDYYPVETWSLSYWENLDFAFYATEDPYLFTKGSEYSFIRRPVYQDIQDEINNGRIGTDALQAMYLLPDVTDFKIEVWFANTFTQAWFPNDYYLGQFNNLLSNPLFHIDHAEINEGFSTGNFAFYWNVAGAPADPTMDQRDIDGDRRIDWRPDAELQLITAAMANMTPVAYTFNDWPSALKFTFTLYDKGRRYFPEGVEFSYIVKLPPRP